MEKTNAMRLLDQKKIDYTVHEYTGGALSGAEVAAQLEEDPERVYKTLVTVGAPRRYYVFMIPVKEELDLKKAAAAAGEKSLSMLPQKELFPLTGYVHGGCSPLGMKKAFPTFIRSGAAGRILFSGGRIGLQIETDFEALARVLPIAQADLTAH